MCTQPVPSNTAIHLRLFGADLNQGVPVTIQDEIAAALEMQDVRDRGEEARQGAVGRLVAARKQAREKELGAVQARLRSDGGLAAMLTACIRCHNCMTACPICYCKTCLFRTASFDHDPDYYMRAARRKGAIRMLSDTLLFHMTRLNHMSLSCVSCGMCTSACPSDIPVRSIFSASGAEGQAAFAYQPGRDPKEPLPLITLQPNEWTEIGEER